MLKKVLATILLATVLINNSSIETYAKNSVDETEREKETATVGEIGGYLEGNIKIVENLRAERRFTYPKGHGFSAERGNNLVDVFKGKNATVVGDDNAKNGADRKIINRNGEVILIQDKYYSNAGRSVSAAFDVETGLYRYVDAEGKPMQLEVPSDQYEKAIESMSKKIEEGKVPGITDSEQASQIIKKGKLSYRQAVNLTKAGTVESLTYDAANGIVVATGAMGISFAINFALCKLNGQSNKDALTNASLDGLKTGGVVFATYAVSSQLAKTGLPTAMAPVTDAVASHLGEGLAKAIIQVYGVETAELTSEQIVSRVSSILSSQLITAGVFVAALSADDVVDLFRGRISKEQLLQNLVVTVASVGGTYVGTVAGGVVGSLIVPGVGTTVGSISGGVLGGTAAGYVASKGMKAFFKSDSDEMYEIISAKFETMCNDYLINQDEADALVDDLKAELAGNTLKDMYQSDDREQFAEDLMKVLFENKIAERETIELPTEEETRTEVIRMLDGIVFVH